jgi:uncharacterized phage protein gp47/JayE
VTYIAEPYPAVTDQILTGLTGGVARETHRFFAGANAFAFEAGAERVLVDSVRVLGQANTVAVTFQPGRDFAIGGDGLLRFLASDEDVTVPAAGATWPDEATEFYVGYYHVDSDRALLTDRNVGSLTRTLAEAFARELAVLRQQLEMVYESAFVETAEGRSLDMVVALLGLERKAREYATGSVRFRRDTPSPADIFVPAGTKVSTALPPPPATGETPKTNAKPVAFVTSEDRTLRRGQLSVEASIRAEEKGAVGIVEAGAITVVNQPVLGVSGVTNDAATVFGSSGESDDELRRRARTVAERAGRATPRALTNALTEIPGIRENDVKVVEELQLRPGVVQVFVADEPTPELAVQVQDAILETRAAGIRVEHNLESYLPAAPSAPTSTGDVREDGTAEPGPAPGGFRFPLCAVVVVFPENPRITGADRSTLQQAVTDAVVANVEGSAVGGTIVYNRVTADLMNVAGVLDLVLDLAPKPDTPDQPWVGKRNLTVPQGQRAVIDPSADVKVTFAGAPVNFDIQMTVTPKGTAGTDDIRAEVRPKLAAYFAAASSTVDATGLMAAVGVSDVYTLDVADLSWTAEYDQAGLIIREPGGSTAATALAEGDRAVLRDVQVEVKP